MITYLCIKFNNDLANSYEWPYVDHLKWCVASVNAFAMANSWWKAEDDHAPADSHFYLLEKKMYDRKNAW